MGEVLISSLFLFLSTLKSLDRVTYNFVGFFTNLKGYEMHVFLSIFGLYMILLSIVYFSIPNKEKRKKFMKFFTLFITLINFSGTGGVLYLWFFSFSSQSTVLMMIPDFLEVQRSWTEEELTYLLMCLIRNCKDYQLYAADINRIVSQSKTGEDIVKIFNECYLEDQQIFSRKNIIFSIVCVVLGIGQVLANKLGV